MKFVRYAAKFFDLSPSVSGIREDIFCLLAGCTAVKNTGSDSLCFTYYYAGNQTRSYFIV